MGFTGNATPCVAHCAVVRVGIYACHGNDEFPITQEPLGTEQGLNSKLQHSAFK